MGRLPIVKPNREKGAIHVSDKLVKTLETKVNDLIELSRELNRENRALKLRAAELQRERRELLERQRQASEHVETSLARLRSLDGSP